MSDLHRSIMKSRLPPMVPNPKFPKPTDRGYKKKSDYNPIMWNEYFKENRDVITEHGTFRCYLTASEQPGSPLLVLLHGGGFSALSWSHFSADISKIIHCQCLAIDIRGHGDTTVDDEEDLSADRLSSDVAEIIHTMYPENAPPIILIGHSMGGAICVHVAHKEILPTLLGIVVIDVVEGTALEALASMQSFLRSRPSTFKSIQHAIEWSVRSGQIRNIESAKVSMPGQIINIETKKLATNELPLLEELPSSDVKTKFANPMSISEDAELSNLPPSLPPPGASMSTETNLRKYTWRIDLSKSEKYWSGWFEGLSGKFLEVKVPKLLLLAGIDNLDKALTVGQMQGKFQLQVLARCGHAVHEDRPNEVAEVIGSYLIRNKFAESASNFTYHAPAC